MIFIAVSRLATTSSPNGGRETAVEQVAVELDPMGAGLVGLDDVVCAAAADLQNHATHF